MTGPPVPPGRAVSVCIFGSPALLVPTKGIIPILLGPYPSEYTRRELVEAATASVMRIEPAKVPGVADLNTTKSVKELLPFVSVTFGSVMPPVPVAPGALNLIDPI